MSGLCLYIAFKGWEFPKLFGLNFHFDVILMPHNTHSWKNAKTAQTRLCHFSGLLCYYFASGHTSTVFFCIFLWKLTYMIDEKTSCYKECTPSDQSSGQTCFLMVFHAIFRRNFDCLPLCYFFA